MRLFFVGLSSHTSEAILLPYKTQVSTVERSKLILDQVLFISCICSHIPGAMKPGAHLDFYFRLKLKRLVRA
jgi:hypothetical protein